MKNQMLDRPHSLRQSMAWLHTWGGLMVCWALFAIFLTGTICLFEGPITQWMKPERTERMIGHDGDYNSVRAVAFAQNELAKVARGAHYWTIGLPNEDDPDVRIYWLDNGRREGLRLDPVNGARIPPKADRQTEGGYHFITFHHEFHSGVVGSWIVGFLAMAMLTALVSGIIIHQRIFKDVFTFRPGKGQRSWLDAHNVAGVLTLPFQAMIAYTGLTLVYSLYMPAAILANYPSKEAYSADLLQKPAHREESGVAAPVMPLDRLLPVAEARLKQEISLIHVEHPGDSMASAFAYGPEPSALKQLAPGRGLIHFDAVTGAVLDIRLPEKPRGGVAQLTQEVLSALHEATFGGIIIKWLYFVAGIAGTVMIGSGAILFEVKRCQRALGEFGGATPRVYRLIEILNIAAITGLAIACIGYFWANRLIEADIAGRADLEVRAFFMLWILGLVHAAARPRRKAWMEQLAGIAMLCLLLPVLNAVTTGDHVIAQIGRGDWRNAGVELVAIAFGLAAIGVIRVIWTKKALSQSELRLARMQAAK